MNHAQICNMLDRLIKKDKRFKLKCKLLIKVVVPILVIILIQHSLGIFQHFRYDIDNYNCVDMSKDCEAFFERMGITTQVVNGSKLDDNGNIVGGHCWLILSLPWGDVEFESTSLMFSKVSNTYKVYSITDGWR